VAKAFTVVVEECSRCPAAFMTRSGGWGCAFNGKHIDYPEDGGGAAWRSTGTTPDWCPLKDYEGGPVKRIAGRKTREVYQPQVAVKGD
jgi:hypothetical protein